MYSEKISMLKNTDLMQRRYLESGKGRSFSPMPCSLKSHPKQQQRVFQSQREIISTSQTYGQKDPSVLRLEKYFLISPVSLNHHQRTSLLPRKLIENDSSISSQKSSLYKGPRSCLVRAIFPTENQIPRRELFTPVSH